MVEEGNRRWRDEEFLVPASFVHGKSRIALEVRNAPDGVPAEARELFPGTPFPMAAGAWTEGEYKAFCVVDA